MRKTMNCYVNEYMYDFPVSINGFFNTPAGTYRGLMFALTCTYLIEEVI